ncbi:FAD-dependent oxidoreductase [Mesorhizobium sp.]|uniref:GcvT family protein n=1 Tax=Mesorhizobium sp. TaxID=1871066 RepID=UPI000FE95798|nr:FAD-dependent oxidoreductase [Mesorhizobium sp.]RWK11034.1 MAG: FAD-dependent oxidoreductase [Mesorhizobium sp.]TIQ49631.1 MAG: FAD-dependent oxidoreductase [Mesorhizobium sp.]TIQ59366.1 MAG: FAD-dependent oxidoreductase [Mesorhizobium sp.]TJV92595.1 MAG: FAD-dependent oxidoreductase [Mesorhizobium sp.]
MITTSPIRPRELSVRRHEILIIGGGIAGSSLAFHLAKNGKKDVAILERHTLTSGTTWHAAGLVTQTRSTHTMTEMAKYTAELYSSLEAETGQATGFKRNGTLGVARTKERLYETARTASIAKSCGLEAHLISPSEAKRLYPALNESIIQGAVFIPGDGQTNPVDTCMALAMGAKQKGVKIFENSEVQDLWRTPDGNYQVRTGEGVIEAEVLVLACGLWTRDLAFKLGARIPLYAAEHFYVFTEPMDFVTPTLPVLRDTDGYVYLKEDAGKLLVGALEPWGKPIPMEKLPKDTPFIELPEDWNQFELPMTKAIEMVPELANAGIAKFFNGPESFTPDLLFMIGEAPGMKNLFISAGYNSGGIEAAAGAGRTLAEWIIAGQPQMDVTSVDVARFHPFQINKRYLHDRTAEVMGLHYKIHWPAYQPETSRGVRKSPLHDRWARLGASFGEGMGWERPIWFAGEGESTKNVYSYDEPNWFKYTSQECKAARNAAILVDQSSFGKHLVQGRDACRFLQWICAGNVDVPVGKLVYTHMLNERGGIETDITVNRLSKTEFLIISSSTVHPRDKAWIARHITEEWNVTITDVTSAYAVLSLQGPKSRQVLSQVTDADLANAAFPFATSQEIDIGYARVIANRLTFIGELGWELHIPTEMAQHVFDVIWEAGQAYGLKPAGYHALEYLRCERAYREYQLDLTPLDTLLEAGLGFTIDWNKDGGFIGKAALLSQKNSGPLEKKLVSFKLRDPNPILFHEEPIRRNGEVVGYISSGAKSFILGQSVGMGYVSHPAGVTKELIENSRWEIEIAGKLYEADASLRAFFDPNGERLGR